MSRSTRDGEHCPQKIIDDFGVCYSLGVVLGSFVNGVKGKSR